MSSRACKRRCWRRRKEKCSHDAANMLRNRPHWPSFWTEKRQRMTAKWASLLNVSRKLCPFYCNYYWYSEKKQITWMTTIFLQSLFNFLSISSVALVPSEKIGFHSPWLVRCDPVCAFHWIHFAMYLSGYELHFACRHLTILTTNQYTFRKFPP